MLLCVCIVRGVEFLGIFGDRNIVFGREIKQIAQSCLTRILWLLYTSDAADD